MGSVLFTLIPLNPKPYLHSESPQSPVLAPVLSSQEHLLPQPPAKAGIQALAAELGVSVSVCVPVCVCVCVCVCVLVCCLLCSPVFLGLRFTTQGFGFISRVYFSV